MFDYRIVRWRFVVVFSLLFTLNVQTWHRDSGIREFSFFFFFLSVQRQKYLLDWIKRAEVSEGSRNSCRRNARGIVCAKLRRGRRFVNHRERNEFWFYCLRCYVYVWVNLPTRNRVQNSTTRVVITWHDTADGDGGIALDANLYVLLSSIWLIKCFTIV